jgi:HEAT repeat protein
LKAQQQLTAAARDALRERLADTAGVVRVEAASALAATGDAERALAVLAEELRHRQPEVALQAARSLELLGERARPVLPAMRQALGRAQAEQQRNDIQMFIRFSLEAALEQLATDGGPRT